MSLGSASAAVSLTSGGRKVLLAGAIVAFVLAFAVAGAVASRSSRRGTPVVVLSPHWEGIIKEFSRGFAEWIKEKHGVEAHVDHVNTGAGTTSIVQYIKNSFRATPDGIGVDVIFGGGPAPHASLAREGLLERIKLPAEVRKGLARDIGGMELSDPLGAWHGAALSSFGIVWNKEVFRRLKDLGHFLPDIKEWTDLTNPNLFGWVASGDPTSSGSAE